MESKDVFRFADIHEGNTPSKPALKSCSALNVFCVLIHPRDLNISGEFNLKNCLDFLINKPVNKMLLQSLC